ncbi:hypothetical protein NKH77_52495 [Streptomyces sp. M19]
MPRGQAKGQRRGGGCESCSRTRGWRPTWRCSGGAARRCTDTAGARLAHQAGTQPGRGRRLPSADAYLVVAPVGVEAKRRSGFEAK